MNKPNFEFTLPDNFSKKDFIKLFPNSRTVTLRELFYVVSKSNLGIPFNEIFITNHFTGEVYTMADVDQLLNN